MPGLLDILGGNFGTDDPRQAAYLALASGLLSGRGNFGQVAGQAAMGGQEAFQSARKAQVQQKLIEAQMADAAAQAKQREQESARLEAIMKMIPGMSQSGVQGTPGQSAGSMQGIPQQAIAMDLLMNKGTNVPKWMYESTKPDYSNIDTGGGTQIVNRNDPNAPRMYKKDLSPGETQTDAWRRFEHANPSAAQQATQAVQDSRLQWETGGLPQSNPVATPKSADVMQMIMEDAKRTGTKAFDFDIGGAKGSVKVPEGKAGSPPILEQVSPKERQQLTIDQPAAQSVASSALQMSDRIKSLASELKTHPGLPSIVGKISQYPALDLLPSTRDARALQDSLVNQIGIQALNDMRQMSKTGGAVGQVTEREWPILQQSIAAVGKAQTPEGYKTALDNLVAQVDSSMTRVRAAYEKTYGKLDYETPPHAKQNTSSSGSSDGWSIKPK
jgi:hypothetical protein